MPFTWWHDKIRDGIEIATRCADETMRIYCDREYMRMCLINLILNSAQAIEDKGRIVVTCCGRGRNGVAFRSRITARAWRGSIDRIFEPYYSTKKLGIGLGLTITKRLVEEHGGTISAQSSAGENTVVTIRVPANAAAHKGTVLVVEDDANQRDIVKTILAKDGFYVEDAGTGRRPWSWSRTVSFDCVLTDLRLPDIEGTEILKEVKSHNIPCHVVVMTAYGSIPSAIEATKLGAFHYLEKPSKKDHLLLVMNNAASQVKLLKDNLMLKDQLFDKFHLDNIIGDHGSMRALFSIVRKVAPTELHRPCLRGERHGQRSFREEHPLQQPEKEPALLCDKLRLPYRRTLLESELFGYEKGAFTGALARHSGLFEQANGSTLFLDEIGDLTLAMQAKILRAIQEKEIRRVGGKETMKLDVRIIAATNKKLEKEIARGNFREDLYYRLNVIAFTIPPLRRQEDRYPHSRRALPEETERIARRQKRVFPPTPSRP